MDFFQLKLFEIFFTFFNFFFWLPAPSPPEKLDTWPTLRRMNEHLEAKKFQKLSYSAKQICDWILSNQVL